MGKTFFIETYRGTQVTVNYSEQGYSVPHAEFFGEMNHTGYRSHFFNETLGGDLEQKFVEMANQMEDEFLRECNSFYKNKTPQGFVIGGMYQQAESRKINWYSGNRLEAGKTYKLLAVKKFREEVKFLLQCPADKNPTYCYEHEVEQVGGQQTLGVWGVC